MDLNKQQFIIYKATSPSGKQYIGITKEALRDRISKHKYTAKRNKTSKKMSAAIKKYGVENFTWDIITYASSKEEAFKLEKYYIKLFDTYKTGYNSTEGGEGAIGVKWSSSSKTKNFQNLKAKYYTNPTWCEHRRQQTILYYKNNPERLEALRKNGRNAITRLDVKEKAKKARNTRDCRIKISRSKGSKPVNVYNFITKMYIGTYDLISDCIKQLNLCNGKVSACLKNKRNFHKTFIFKYVDDPTVIGTEFNDLWLLNIKRSPNRERDR